MMTKPLLDRLLDFLVDVQPLTHGHQDVAKEVQALIEELSPLESAHDFELKCEDIDDHVDLGLVESEERTIHLKVWHGERILHWRKK